MDIIADATDDNNNDNDQDDGLMCWFNEETAKYTDVMKMKIIRK